MKIFTHNFVIYRDGWVFEWEPKEPQGYINLGEIFEIALCLMILYLVFFK